MTEEENARKRNAESERVQTDAFTFFSSNAFANESEKGMASNPGVRAKWAELERAVVGVCFWW